MDKKIESLRNGIFIGSVSMSFIGHFQVKREIGPVCVKKLCVGKWVKVRLRKHSHSATLHNHQPRPQASSSYPRARLTVDFTSEFAEDDWERDCIT